MTTPAFSTSAAQPVLAKLSLDFTTASLDPRITFTRALATATRVNSSGYVAAVAADTPRFDYDPVTLACKGLLIEESRQNLYIYSQDFNDASWVKSAATIGNDVAVSPDGTQNADKLIETATTATHYMYRTLTPTSGTSYTFSVYAKAAGRTTFRLNAGGGFVIQATFNLTTVTATLGAGTSASITPVGNDWYRCTVSGTATGSAAGQCQTILQTGTYAGDGTSGILFWGAQLEVGLFPTSYIPTTTTSLTRNADVAVMTGSNFSSWFNAVQGMFRADAYSIATGTRCLISADDNTSSNSLVIRTETTTPKFIVNSSGVEQANVSAGTVSANTLIFAYTSYGTDYFGIARPSARQVDTSGTVPVVDRLRIGVDQAGNYLNTQIQKIQFWN